MIDAFTMNRFHNNAGPAHRPGRTLRPRRVAVSERGESAARAMPTPEAPAPAYTW